MPRLSLVLVFLCGAASALPVPARAAPGTFTMAEITSYPFPTELTAAKNGTRIAWVRNERGVRNIYVASGPDFRSHRVTEYKHDDGQELTQLSFAPDGKTLVYVRGGDHDANWPDPDKMAPDPDDSPVQAKVMLWAVALPDGKPVKLGEGDAPAISADNRLAYIKDHKVWTVALDGKGKARRLFFDRGKDGSLHFSPDGKRLAFVSDRGAHALIGLFTASDQPIEYLAPSTGRDFSPRWSPDGKRIAFVRLPGEGGPPQPILTQTPQPWSIWIADTATGNGHAVWRSPETLQGSFPETAGNANLDWAAGERLVFLSDIGGWPHLYSIDAGTDSSSAASSGGASGDHQSLLLTPGKFMVESVSLSPDRSYLVYNANTGNTPGDDDRRHLFRVPVDAASPVALTHGETLQWQPVLTGDGQNLAYISAGARRPPLVRVADTHGAHARDLAADAIPEDFPTDSLVVPRPVTFTAADRMTIHGQLFQGHTSDAPQPGIIFVHGGPPRQMLLGWHYMDYYSNAYAVNQYLANHGFVVLSVNYRLGIGYGRAFHHPAHWGPTGASEYQDVVAGAKFLQGLKGVDAARIGIWGGSYGGYLTALALARNSDIFKAGVDLHGVHDWSRFMDDWYGKPDSRYEKGDRKQAMKVAWQSSPDADIASWTSPVLLIQGDDDRNVHFQQTIDLARRLQKHAVPFEELVLPNEIHGFLRHASWLRADTATAGYFQVHLKPGGS